MQHSTIAAIATAPGAGGIAIVRLSGPESYEVAAKVFRPANPAKKVEGFEASDIGLAHRRNLRQERRTLLGGNCQRLYRTGSHLS